MEEKVHLGEEDVKVTCGLCFFVVFFIIHSLTISANGTLGERRWKEVRSTIKVLNIIHSPD